MPRSMSSLWWRDSNKIAPGNLGTVHLAAWWMARDKRGVSALLLARELGLRYETAWLMAHKLRHALTERPEFPLQGLVEVDESYYGGRGKPESRGRSLANPNKSLLVMAVEKRPVGPGKGIKASGFVAGHARLAAGEINLTAASADHGQNGICLTYLRHRPNLVASPR